MVQTLHDKYVEALQLRGHHIVKGKGGRYTWLFRKNNKEGRATYYFVGHSGAVRFGTSATGSIPCSDKWKEELLKGKTSEDWGI